MKTTIKKSAPQEKYHVNSQFTPVGIKSLDTKNRISLGSRAVKNMDREGKVDAYQVFKNDEGDILLRPTVNIPAHEAWIYQNPSVLTKIRKGLTEAREGKLERTKNVDKFIEKL